MIAERTKPINVLLKEAEVDQLNELTSRLMQRGEKATATAVIKKALALLYRQREKQLPIN